MSSVHVSRVLPSGASKPQEAPIVPLIDSHCHLDDSQFDVDRDAVLARFRAAGGIAAVTIGTDPDGCRRAVALAEAHPGLYAAIAVHPTEAGREVSDSEGALLNDLARHPRVVAVGETGLDWRGDRAPREAQRALFSRFIALARASGKPLVIHCRDAYPECLAQLRAAWPPPVRGVLHCFSGTAEDARAALDLGLFLSIAGPVSYPSARALREIARSIPSDRLLIETDAPWLPPQSKRGRRNEPAYVAETAAALALARGEPLEALAAATAANARALFGIA
jgi:TatD DNase family protein